MYIQKPFLNFVSCSSKRIDSVLTDSIISVVNGMLPTTVDNPQAVSAPVSFE